MSTNIIGIALLFGAALFFLIVGMLAVFYEMKSSKEEQKDWLFANFYEKMYDALFSKKNPQKIAKKLGINSEEYFASAFLVEKEPNLVRLIMNQIFGLLLLIFFCGISLLSGNILFCFVGALAFILLAFMEKNALKKEAENRKIEVGGNLPRFIDLLQTELIVGLPVEIAIRIICEKTEDMLLSREFLKAYADTKTGAVSWAKSLENVASKYDIDELSDLVLNITTAYNKGVSVTKAVVRKAKNAKRTRVLTIKEKAEKVTSKVLLPTMLFQLAPIMLFLIIPVYSQLNFAM